MKKKVLSTILSLTVVLASLPMVCSAAYAATYTKAGEVTAVTVSSSLITNPSLGAKNPLSEYEHEYVDLTPSSPKDKGVELVNVTWQKKDSTGKFSSYYNDTFEAGVYRLEGSLRTLSSEDRSYYALTDKTTLTVNGTAWTNSGKPIKDNYSDIGSGYNWYYSPEYPVSKTTGKYSVSIEKEGNGKVAASTLEAVPGTAVALTATPDPRYVFKGWQVLAGGVTISNNRFVMGSKDVIVKAIFEKVPYAKAGEVSAVTVGSPLITKPSLGAKNPLSEYEHEYVDLTPSSPEDEGVELVEVTWQKKDDTGSFQDYYNGTFQVGVYRLEGSLRTLSLEDRSYYALTDRTTLTVNGTAWTNLGGSVNDDYSTYGFGWNRYYSPEYAVRYDLADKAAGKVKLSATKYVYSGKARKPAVTISGLKEGRDFTVSYRNNTNVGKAAVRITGKGDYKGTVTKYFRIIPKRAAISALTPGQNKLTVKASSRPSAKGASTYQIAYRQKGTSKWKYTTAAKQSAAIAKLKKSKRYYVKIRARKIVNGIKYDGAWSRTVLSAKIK